MKFPRMLLFAATVAPLLLVSQGNREQEDKRFAEIKAKHDKGETVTAEEREFAQSVMERRNQSKSAERNASWAKDHPPQESVGKIPLSDPGSDGMYPNGQSTPPAAHLKAGMALSRQIVPLDQDGKRANDGKIVLITIGMSNTTQESRLFQKLAEERKSELNPRLVIVDGAQGAQTAAITAKPDSNYWKVAEGRLKEAGVTANQIQAAWLKQANAGPKEPFPAEAKKLQADLVETVHNLHDKYPNLKLVFLSSRIYGGYASSPLNPEPHAYETGFAVKWLIADQIAGKPELNSDPKKGAVRAPWLAWGPYLWADGMKGRKDGLLWAREDLGPDGTHPSMQGREKVGRLLVDFFTKNEVTRPWFMKR